jgi:hypothetical protein
MTQENIYNLITNSAKIRFDYTEFEKMFSLLRDIDDSIADSMLFKILICLAEGNNPKVIALKMENEILLMGFCIQPDNFEKIISANQKNWEKEIIALKKASNMLNSNFASVIQVYDLVSKLLTN